MIAVIVVIVIIVIMILIMSVNDGKRFAYILRSQVQPL